MEGWSSLKNGSSCYVDFDVKVYDECEARLRSLFDQVLLVFLKEDCNKPFPVILGDEKSLDLFKLFMVVRQRGGFDSVSRDGLWGFVAKQLGFDCRVSPSVRLVYSKYLNGIEKWVMENSRVMKSAIRDRQNSGCVDSLLQELGNEFEGLLNNGLNEKGNKDNGIAVSEYKNNGNYIDKFVKETKLNLPISRKRCRENGDDDEKVDDGDDVIVLDSCHAKNLFSSRRRKQESLSYSLSETVNWVIQVAKCPNDPSIGVIIPDRSKWKEHKGKEYWIQAIRLRQALVQKRNVKLSTDKSLLQSNQKIHPSIYNDSQHSTKRSRCSERLSSVTKSRSCSCCISFSITKPACPQIKEPDGSRTTISQKTESKLKKTPGAIDIPVPSTRISSSGNEFPRRHVSIGSSFQVEVPQWTKPLLDNDSKWLGTCFWSLEKGQNGNLLENCLMGKGRPDSCSCDFPGSVECVRFHIAENRMKLKHELGPIFFHWKFNCMGEEVSLRWADREEKTFKDMLTSNSIYFWGSASKLFPRKSRRDLVSYYFNVLLINRRRYQNWVTPKDIDSDDDESEFGSIGYSFGHEGVRVLGSDIMICSQNSQCIDLD